MKWIGVSLFLSVVVQAQEGTPTNNNNNPNNDPGCANGQCPSPSDVSSENNQCGIWMGPSPIKHAEKHGFGLGLFTGRPIPKGTTVESLYGTAGEVILPLYGSLSIHNDHTPLREYVWDENTIPELAIEYPLTMTYQFMPGASSIIPCTNKNYNLDIVGDGKADTDRQSVIRDTTLHRSRHPAAGAVASRNQAAFVAIRDIAAGEELTCRCTDDDFDGGVYYLARYAASDRLFCVDDATKVDTSLIPNIGKGLFAKRKIAANEKIITTPMVPIHRREMMIDQDEDMDGELVEVNEQQLMLNYAYGHENSDLLLLPYGPLVNFINHYGGDDTKTRKPNAKIMWHQVNKTAYSELERRQEHHHDEFFAFSGHTVASTHGVSFTMDVVATRDIAPNEEIYLDYGPAWQRAWEAHVKKWKLAQKQQSVEDINYISAEAFVNQQGGPEVPFRTLAEQEANPYPKNLETFCFYSGAQDSDEVWDDEDLHECFRPCQVLERRINTDDGKVVYNVQFDAEDNYRIVTECVVDDNYLLHGIPHHNVRLVDRPFTADVFLPTAFRQEIGVPSGFYPLPWMKQNLRVRSTDSTKQQQVMGEEFKRKIPTSSATRGVVVEEEVKAVE